MSKNSFLRLRLRYKELVTDCNFFCQLFLEARQLLSSDFFPTEKYSFRLKLIREVFRLQKRIAQLGSIGNTDGALFLITKYVSHLCVRLFVVGALKGSIIVNFLFHFKILEVSDCFYMLKYGWFLIGFKSLYSVKKIYFKKGNDSVYSVLLSSVFDKIAQRQVLMLLDPLVKAISKFNQCDLGCERFYGQLINRLDFFFLNKNFVKLRLLRFEFNS